MKRKHARSNSTKPDFLHEEIVIRMDNPSRKNADVKKLDHSRIS